MPQIVQFLHPGSEHEPDRDNPLHKSWVAAGEDHGRKFLLSRGKYFDPNGGLVEADLDFWGEWEPPSFVQPLGVPRPGYPKARQRPYLPPLGCEGIVGQNTDPLVFGDTFVYAICRQPGSPALRSLEIGSLILFGSMKGKRGAETFQLDTVFVIGSSSKFHMNPPSFDGCFAKEPFPKRVVLEAACGHDVDARTQLTCYLGATPKEPRNELYSFVPSRVFDGQASGFPRLALGKSDYVNPKLTQGFKISHDVPAAKIRAFWTTIRQQVLDAGFVEGVHFSEPGPSSVELMFK